MLCITNPKSVRHRIDETKEKSINQLIFSKVGILYLQLAEVVNKEAMSFYINNLVIIVIQEDIFISPANYVSSNY
jgi:hypothetical protein